MFSLKIKVLSFVGDPYWPQRAQVINITKESGMARARSTANRRKALEAYLSENNLTLADFERLEQEAEYPFHLNDDGFVVFPKHMVDGMLTAACTMARAAQRPCPPEQVRVLLRSSPWISDRRPEEALDWQRYVVVSSGTGAKLSNQRALRTNKYLGDQPPGDLPTTAPVLATGRLELDQSMVKPEVVQRLLDWAGQRVGIGASRKMGWGRFQLLEFEKTED